MSWLEGQVWTVPNEFIIQSAKFVSYPLHRTPLKTSDKLWPPKTLVCTACAAYPNPNCLQTTIASKRPHPSPQTSCQLSETFTSTLPSNLLRPPLKRILMSSFDKIYGFCRKFIKIMQKFCLLFYVINIAMNWKLTQNEIKINDSLEYVMSYVLCLVLDFCESYIFCENLNFNNLLEILLFWCLKWWLGLLVEAHHCLWSGTDWYGFGWNHWCCHQFYCTLNQVRSCYSKWEQEWFDCVVFCRGLRRLHWWYSRVVSSRQTGSRPTPVPLHCSTRYPSKWALQQSEHRHEKSEENKKLTFN